MQDINNFFTLNISKNCGEIKTSDNNKFFMLGESGIMQATRHDPKVAGSVRNFFGNSSDENTNEFINLFGGQTKTELFETKATDQATLSSEPFLFLIEVKIKDEYYKVRSDEFLQNPEAELDKLSVYLEKAVGYIIRFKIPGGETAVQGFELFSSISTCDFLIALKLSDLYYGYLISADIKKLNDTSLENPVTYFDVYSHTAAECVKKDENYLTFPSEIVNTRQKFILHFSCLVGYSDTFRSYDNGCFFSDSRSSGSVDIQLDFTAKQIRVMYPFLCSMLVEKKISDLNEQHFLTLLGETYTENDATSNLERSMILALFCGFKHQLISFKQLEFVFVQNKDEFKADDFQRLLSKSIRKNTPSNNNPKYAEELVSAILFNKDLFADIINEWNDCYGLSIKILRVLENEERSINSAMCQEQVKSLHFTFKFYCLLMQQTANEVDRRRLSIRTINDLRKGLNSILSFGGSSLGKSSSIERRLIAYNEFINKTINLIPRFDGRKTLPAYDKTFVMINFRTDLGMSAAYPILFAGVADYETEEAMLANIVALAEMGEGSTDFLGPLFSVSLPGSDSLSGIYKITPFLMYQAAQNIMPFEAMYRNKFLINYLLRMLSRNLMFDSMVNIKSVYYSEAVSGDINTLNALHRVHAGIMSDLFVMITEEDFNNRYSHISKMLYFGQILDCFTDCVKKFFVKSDNRLKEVLTSYEYELQLDYLNNQILDAVIRTAHIHKLDINQSEILYSTLYRHVATKNGKPRYDNKAVALIMTEVLKLLNGIARNTLLGISATSAEIPRFINYFMNGLYVELFANTELLSTLERISTTESSKLTQKQSMASFEDFKLIYATLLDLRNKWEALVVFQTQYMGRIITDFDAMSKNSDFNLIRTELPKLVEKHLNREASIKNVYSAELISANTLQLFSRLLGFDESGDMRFVLSFTTLDDVKARIVGWSNLYQDVYADIIVAEMLKLTAFGYVRMYMSNLTENSWIKYGVYQEGQDRNNALNEERIKYVVATLIEPEEHEIWTLPSNDNVTVISTHRFCGDIIQYIHNKLTAGYEKVEKELITYAENTNSLKKLQPFLKVFGINKNKIIQQLTILLRLANEYIIGDGKHDDKNVLFDWENFGDYLVYIKNADNYIINDDKLNNSYINREQLLKLFSRSFSEFYPVDNIIPEIYGMDIPENYKPDIINILKSNVHLFMDIYLLLQSLRDPISDKYICIDSMFYNFMRKLRSKIRNGGYINNFRIAGTELTEAFTESFNSSSINQSTDFDALANEIEFVRYHYYRSRGRWGIMY